MPKISIIVPVYNVEQYLHRCVDSILNQTFPDFELILVDDGSPDNCGRICDEYSKKDSRIVVIHKDNGGLSDARNAGIDWAFQNSSSEWITFIDSDDFVHKRYLELLYCSLQDGEYNISVCNYKRFSDECFDAEFDNVKIYRKSVERHFCEHPEIIVACAKLYRKSLFKNMRYPIGKIHEDEFVTYQLLFAQENIAVVDCNLYYYFINPNSITGSKWSENNLSLIDARESQLKFYESNGYMQAYALIAKKYLIYLAEILAKHIKDLPKKRRKKVEKRVRHLLKKSLKRFKTFYPYNITNWIFLVAHPFIEKVLYLFKIIK